MCYSKAARAFCRLFGIHWAREPFDQAYFAAKMREARQRRKELRERVRALIPPRTSIGGGEDGLVPADLGILDDLIGDCENIFATNTDVNVLTARQIYDPETFNRAMLAAMLKKPVQNFQDLPVVLEEPRLDRVFRFATLVSMAHYGQVVLEQPDADTILVIMRRQAWEAGEC